MAIYIEPRLIYPPDTQFKKVCRIEGDLTNLPLSLFTQYKTKATGEPYWIVDFTLLAIFSGTKITWQYLYKGEAKGSVIVSYDE